MADTPEAHRSLDNAVRLFYDTDDRIFSQNAMSMTRKEGDQYLFEHLWSMACEINRLLGKHAVASPRPYELYPIIKAVQAKLSQAEKQGQQLRLPAGSTINIRLKPPYKGSDSVPF